MARTRFSALLTASLTVATSAALVLPVGLLAASPASADAATSATPAVSAGVSAGVGTQNQGATGIGSLIAEAGLVNRRHRSGLTWPSGAFLPALSPTRYAQFGAWRGHKLDVAVTWAARQTWDDVINPDWLYQTWAGKPVTKVIGVAPLPEAVPSATLARCASGAYDDKWEQFGRNIRDAGLSGSTIIRLGWEFNGNWYKWSAHDPEAFVGCWRHIVRSAERTAPALRWDWTVNRGPGQSVRDARRAWPGIKYVDVVGIDSYDVWPAARTASGWNAQLNGAYGLNFWLRFAKAHGKKLSVPEWGVYPGYASAGQNGGDNPYYVQRMVGFFRANAPYIAYESYFNESAPYYAGSIFGPTQNPRAAQAYRAAL